MKKLIVLSVILLPLLLKGQIGGQAVYDFLRLSPSARITAMGGVNVSTIDDDVHFGFMNPALVNDSMHHHLALSITNYLSDIGFGYAGYSRNIPGLGNVHTGFHYITYGSFEGRDEFGNPMPNFSARELAWVIGLSRSLKDFRYGANLKLITSTLASSYGYSSFGIALDAGAAYNSPNKLFSAGLVVKNMGAQLSTYVPGAEREGLPFEVQLGITNKLRYMPLRFSVTLVNLEHPNLIFEDPDKEPLFDLSGQPIKEKNPLLDKVFRHIVFGGEFLLGNALRIRGGYNHMRRQELQSANRSGLTGFSLGFGLRVSRFAFDYGFSSYGVANEFGTHQFSLRMDLNPRKEGK